ncbi:MAG: hypothetical protein PHU23_17640 [Dehalococcoidales bacterium]|nr:hypothetical protein [Dehalococcoidales bacterium]
MKLEQAEIIANQVKDKLSPYCEKVEIAGSIRRRRPWVNDIDIVAIPSNQGQFVYQLRQLGSIKLGGQKIIRVTRPEIELDIYIATPETWATLLLIRTGSKRHNVYLCKLARYQGMKLHADGSGLFRLGGMRATKDAADGTFDETRIAGDTEGSIFEELGLKYKKPEDRE